jgi:ribosome maturation factor RimP
MMWSTDRKKEKISRLLEEPLAIEGAELVELVISRYKNNVTLRVFVYAADGVPLDKCARLSRIIGDIIDGTDMFEGGYTLEVSSPGLDRPLTALRDFRYRIGEDVRIAFADRSRKKVTAEIVSTTDDAVVFRNAEGEFRIGLDEIEEARIVF